LSQNTELVKQLELSQGVAATASAERDRAMMEVSLSLFLSLSLSLSLCDTRVCVHTHTELNNLLNSLSGAIYVNAEDVFLLIVGCEG